jgi:ribosomal protein S18 acetylase RimI-like enzyme
MPLPILQAHQDATTADLVRLFHRTELHFTRHLGEETSLDVGTAFTNPQLGDFADANRVLELGLPEGMTPADAMRQVRDHYAGSGTRCRDVVLNPTMPPAQTAALAEYLAESGWTRQTADILYLSGRMSGPLHQAPGLTIIPARASFRHARILAEQAADEARQPQLVEALLAHLDDPHWDALLALDRGEAVGAVGVLAVGEIGRIDGLFVTPSHRRRGIARTLMGRALEICIRSVFRHVMVTIKPENQAAKELYRSFGFQSIGQMIAFTPGAPTKADRC